MIGQERTCDTCGEAKIISNKTFAQNGRSPDGVATTCRQCQGRAARKKQTRAGRASPEERAQILEAPKHPTGWPDPVEDRAGYWRQVEETTARLYEIGNMRHKGKELAEVSTELNKVTRLWGDAGGGEQTDIELAFRTFAHVLSKLISNWVAWGEIHDCSIIPALLDEASDQVLLLASRNSGKSTITEMYGTWLLHRNPMDIIGVVSGSARRAKRTLRTVRQFIENCPLLSPLKPNDECLDSADQFVVPAANGHLGSAVSFSSFGLAASMAGHRFNRAILDDIEQKRDRTPGAQETLTLLSSEIQNIVNPNGRVVALGTPQVAGMSIYGRWAKSDEWKTWRALLFEELPQDHNRSTKPQLRSRWLTRWSDEQLEKKRRSLPAREWDLHWRLDLSALEEDDRPLKLRDFITVAHDPALSTFPATIRGGGERLTRLETGVADADDYFRGPSHVSKETSRYVLTVAAVDPASGMKGRDEVGVAVVSVTSSGLGVIRCIDGVRGHSASETLTNTAILLHQFTPNQIICEARADSLYPTQLASVLARRGFPATVEPVQSGARKGERILDAIGVPLADSRLVILEAVVKSDDAAETIKQITHMTADARGLRHDDRADALAWAVSAVKDSITLDPADGLATDSQKTLERLLRLPIRQGGITEDGLEARLFEMSEHEERLQMKLDHALAIQEEELKMGKHDPQFGKYIEALQRDLRKMRRYA